MKTYYCVSPLLILVLLVIISNLLLIRRIYKTNTSPNGAGLILKLIGLSNIAYATFICIRSAVKTISAPAPVLWFTSTASVVTSYLHLGFNVSLAFERFQVVSHPMEYHTTKAKKILERKLSLMVSILSMITGVSSSVLRFLFKNILIISMPLAALRAVGYITLCLLYYKLYLAMKAQNQAIAPSSNERCQPSNSNNEVIRRRQRYLGKRKKFFIGITTSFFVLNLPTMVVFFMVTDIPHCTTPKGILSTVSIALSLFNMIFDSVWYFYVDKNSQRLQQ